MSAVLEPPAIHSGMATEPQIVFERVGYRYPGQEEPVLAGVDWTIEAGEFVLVAGPSGSGKSTLLRCLNGLVPHFSGGRFAGSVTIAGQDTRRYGPRALSRLVGFVFQDPEAQLVAQRVDDDLAFGMEQLGVPPLTMRKRVEEVLDLLGIANLRGRDVATLSGGERQRVAVAAALALQPAVLVLDEPTSQLDPWGAEEVLTALSRLNEDLGLTVVLAEHRLERVIGHVDRVRFQAEGRRDGGAEGRGVGNRALDLRSPSGIDVGRGEGVLDGLPREVLGVVPEAALPPVVALGRRRGWAPLPLTVKEGRAAVRRDAFVPLPPPADPTAAGGAPIVALRKVGVGHGRQLVLRDLDLEVGPGELVALMGRNGSGKTTLLRTVMGLHRPERGRVSVFGRDAAGLDAADLARAGARYVPQNPGALLFAERLRDEVAFARRQVGRQGGDPEEILARLGLRSMAQRNPHDLSGGERQRAALAAVLVGEPRLLLLDEPTRGMDYVRKRDLGGLLRELCAEGVAVVMATHDVELVAAMASRVVLLGDGEIVADGSPRAVLSGSLTFATQINKLYGDGFLTVADVMSEA